MAIDFEAEGLLEGTSGEAREARLDLLRQLADDGVELEELRTAVEEDRLALLPVERVLAGDPGELMTPAEIAERRGSRCRDAAAPAARPRPAARSSPTSGFSAPDDLEAAKRVQGASTTPGCPRTRCSRWPG